MNLHNIHRLSKSEEACLEKFRQMAPHVLDKTVRRLGKGESVYSIARWLSDVRPEGATQKWSFNTYRRYLRVLRKVVKREMKIAAAEGTTGHDPIQKIAADAARSIIAEIDKSRMQQPRKVVTLVEPADLDASTMLLYAYLLQEDRVSRMMEAEKKTGMRIPNAYLEIRLLGQIGASVGKLTRARKAAELKLEPTVRRKPSPPPSGMEPHIQIFNAGRKLRPKDPDSQRVYKRIDDIEEEHKYPLPIDITKH